jgi:hypothetical protein
LAFFRWSNGGTFRNRKRVIEFFKADWVRNVMVGNLFLMAAPAVVPFAGVWDEADFYGFDTSAEPIGGEFPVVYIAHGGPMWERMVLAPTFPDFCRGADRRDTATYWDWWRRKHGIAEKPGG